MSYVLLYYFTSTVPNTLEVIPLCEIVQERNTSVTFTCSCNFDKILVASVLIGTVVCPEFYSGKSWYKSLVELDDMV
jgi:hypothetical protein